MKPIYIILIIVALLILIAVIGGYIGYRMAFYNSKKEDRTFAVLTGPGYEDIVEDEINLIKKALEIPFEQVYMKTYDGKRLAGRLYIYDEHAPILLGIHGYKGIGIRDMAGGLQSALKNKCNILVVDQRGSGLSDGHTLSFGVKERKDIICWIDFIKNRFGKDVKIGLLGISMGASTCLMSLSLNLPDNVKMVLVDCPFSSPRDIVRKVSIDKGFKWWMAASILYTGAFLFGHFNLKGASAVESVKNASLPIGIVHGKQDSFVPFEMSEKIADANHNIKLYAVEGADHGVSYFRNNKMWEDTFKEYIENYLTNC